MRLAFVMSLSCVVACAEIVGLGDLPTTSAGDASPDVIADVAVPHDAGPPLCTNATEVFATDAGLEALAATNGFVFAELAFATGDGVLRCATTGDCTSNTSFITVDVNDTLESYSANAASLLHYSIQGPAIGQGSIHAANLDATGDQTLEMNLAAPSWIASAGAKTFWVDDPIAAGDTTPAVVHCIGCSGPDAPWIAGLGQTYALFTDAMNVYVLADDDLGQGTLGLFACSMSAACAAAPNNFVSGLDEDTTSACLAGDGTHAYVVEPDEGTLMRYDLLGNSSTLGGGISTFSTIAVDATAGNIFYGTSDGNVGALKTSGAGNTALSSCSVAVDDVTFDATNVYVHVAPTPSSSIVYAIPR
jgi:hypothetical protein